MIKINTILCGTGYGATYLPILAGVSDFNLCGIYSRGSERSFKYSQRLNIPNYTCLSKLPENIQLAVIAISGKSGTDLAKHFLNQGTHVLLEHPIDPASLQELISISQAGNAKCFINSHFRYTHAISNFLELIETQQLKPNSIVVSTSARTLFSLLDILIDGFGNPDNQEITFQQTDKYLQCFLCIKNSTVLLNLQSWKLADDDGSDVCMGHVIQAFYQSKSIQLVNTWGPVIEQKQVINNVTYPLVRISGELTSPQDIFSSRRTANKNILLSLKSAIETNEIPKEQKAEHLLTVAKLWQQIKLNTNQT